MKKLQAAIVDFLMEHAHIAHEAKIHRLRDEATSNSFELISSRVIEAAPEFEAVCTLASVSSNVFLALTDCDVHEIAQVLASIEEYDHRRRLSVGDTIVLDNEYLIGKGFRGALLLRPASSNVYESVPDSAELCGNQISFLLSVFITNKEYEYKKQEGFDALLEKLDKEGRSFVFTGYNA